VVAVEGGGLRPGMRPRPPNAQTWRLLTQLPAELRNGILCMAVSVEDVAWLTNV